MELCKGFLQDGNIDFPVCAPESAWEHPAGDGEIRESSEIPQWRNQGPRVVEKEKKKSSKCQGLGTSIFSPQIKLDLE